MRGAECTQGKLVHKDTQESFALPALSAAGKDACETACKPVMDGSGRIERALVKSREYELLQLCKTVERHSVLVSEQIARIQEVNNKHILAVKDACAASQGATEFLAMEWVNETIALFLDG